ncbi:hypothetical protein PVAND_005492 [Polypedilum vanderplanki]|uniref:Enoyl-CoA delta isomerase 1, mitochondrial n=1 Tax=Polypedilum vanderplanki TaxID=319348 RepID=A0A9J6C125_POLVA|nr:hypothetical protein PVAND_005492 [Polypedilum vanderplanki]
MNFSRLLKTTSALTSRWLCSGRFQSTSAAAQKLVDVSVDSKTGVSIVSLNRKPVNSLSLELFKEFCGVMDDLESEKVRGMILKSSCDNVFSSGLDITELYPHPDEDRFHAFWLWFQETWIKLYGSSFPTVAFINGHAPAGGCVLAISCEYRIMLPYYKIGLNEAPVGIVAPDWVVNSLKSVLASRKAEQLLTSGRLLDTQEAFDIGLIDKIVNNEEEALARSEEFFSTFDNVPKLARALTKQQVRKNEISKLIKNRSNDAKLFLNHILRPETQKIIGSYFKSLKDRKK